jgi:hypothetical protein
MAAFVLEDIVGQLQQRLCGLQSVQYRKSLTYNGATCDYFFTLNAVKVINIQ